MHLEFELRGICFVPEGTEAVPALANHFRLSSGQVVSIQSIIEISSGADADDHRDLCHAEATALGLFLELDARDLSLEPGERGP